MSIDPSDNLKATVQRPAGGPCRRRLYRRAALTAAAAGDQVTFLPPRRQGARTMSRITTKGRNRNLLQGLGIGSAVVFSHAGRLSADPSRTKCFSGVAWLSLHRP